MNKAHALIAGTVLLALAPGLLAAQGKSAGGNKKLYCWNENGRKVCGDALPASAVDSERTEISASSGMTTGRLGRALTAEERAAAAEAARQQALADAEAAALLRREKAMAESYATENELRRAYENRIVLLDETVKASELGIAGLRQSLVHLLRQAGEIELKGKPVGKAVADTIQGQHQELLRQQDMLTQQRNERVEVEGEFQAALERYRELKNPAPNERG
ncbi:hypothetical protein [Marilutibacter aestuarii]|uniref:DUF4124 domain-containing protein n=1 Tax=Marilutibacter aestuarii TaxID=1706195 RepID=A0A508ALR6_9GAMM|nr:hypothetical protein [Lysobacter aestuarii]TQD51070.1 hypothetical protein FKV25_02515 [Lysobacter aestuarii]